MHSDSGIIDRAQLDDVSDVAFVDDAGWRPEDPAERIADHVRAPTSRFRASRRYEEYNPSPRTTRRVTRVDNDAWAASLRNAGIPVCGVCRLRNARDAERCVDCGAELALGRKGPRPTRRTPRPIDPGEIRSKSSIGLLPVLLTLLCGYGCFLAFGHML